MPRPKQIETNKMVNETSGKRGKQRGRQEEKRIESTEYSMLSSDGFRMRSSMRFRPN